MNQPNWSFSQEKYLRKLHHESHTLAEYNRYQYKTFTNLNRRFSIPILVISGVNSLFALSLQSFLEQKYISIINACLSLVCSILGSIQMFMKIEEKIHNYIICAHEFNKLAYEISKELNLERSCRNVEGKQFVVECFNEFNRILDKQETKERHTKLFLLLPQAEFDDETTEASQPSTPSQHVV